MDSSNASGNSRRTPEPATCRLDWRVSRWQLAGLIALALAAGASPWLAAIPFGACVALDAAVAGYAGWRVWRELARKPAELAWDAGTERWQVTCADRVEHLHHVTAQLRGGLAVLVLADEHGAIRRYLWWPDTLDASGRRALRLWLAFRPRDTSVTAVA